MLDRSLKGEGTGCRRQQDLTTVAGSHDAGGAVDIEANVTITAQTTLPGMQTHPYPHPMAARLWLLLSAVPARAVPWRPQVAASARAPDAIKVAIAWPFASPAPSKPPGGRAAAAFRRAPR